MYEGTSGRAPHCRCSPARRFAVRTGSATSAWTIVSGPVPSGLEARRRRSRRSGRRWATRRRRLGVRLATGSDASEVAANHRVVSYLPAVRRPVDVAVRLTLTPSIRMSELMRSRRSSRFCCSSRFALRERLAGRVVEVRATIMASQHCGGDQDSISESPARPIGAPPSVPRGPTVIVRGAAKLTPVHRHRRRGWSSPDISRRIREVGRRAEAFATESSQRSRRRKRRAWSQASSARATPRTRACRRCWSSPGRRIRRSSYAHAAYMSSWISLTGGRLARRPALLTCLAPHDEQAADRDQRRRNRPNAMITSTKLNPLAGVPHPAS